MAPNLGTVDYTTVKEDFNIYEIENGQILKAKNILAEIINVEKDGKLGARFAVKTVSHVMTPTFIDTSEMEIATPETVSDKDQVRELNFKPIKEISCIYETKKSIIVFETQVSHVYLTNKKVKEGEPILRFNSTTDIGFLQKMSYIKMLPAEERQKLEQPVVDLTNQDPDV
jgi:hypothetical protein